MTLIIAEAGVNHNGQENLAYELIDVAHQAGADIVKFQTFKAKSLVTKTAQQADYQITNTKKEESQLSMLSRLELSYETHVKLVEYCNHLGIEFLSTAFDEESLRFLVNELGLKKLKIPSGEITNAPLILEHARTGCELIVSTGMANLAEVEMALGIIAFGYTAEQNSMPSIQAFRKAYASADCRRILKDKVTILHCTTEYPAPMDEINLKVMDTFSQAFELPVGYSDHSEGITIPIAAAARGAVLIEKHFTLDKNMNGPDHKASLDPSELGYMVRSIREVEKALGHGVKTPTQSEVKNKAIARKSLIAACDISEGEIFSVDNVGIKRPGNGIEPIHYWSIVGTAADKSYKEDDLIQ